MTRPAALWRAVAVTVLAALAVLYLFPYGWMVLTAVKPLAEFYRFPATILPEQVTLSPFVSAARANGGAVFVLVKTSNPGSRDLQEGGSAERVAAEVARLGAAESGDLSTVGAVVGATHPGELRAWRERMPRATLRDLNASALR